eukprot:4881087-Pyramimonas_sp.AAC.1
MGGSRPGFLTPSRGAARPGDRLRARGAAEPGGGRRRRRASAGPRGPLVPARLRGRVPREAL